MVYETESLKNIKTTLREDFLKNYSDVLSSIRAISPIKELYLKQTLLVFFALGICMVFGIVLSFGIYKFDISLLVIGSLGFLISAALGALIYIVYADKIKKIYQSAVTFEISQVMTLVFFSALLYFVLIANSTGTDIMVPITPFIFVGIACRFGFFNNKLYKNLIKKYILSNLMKSCDYVKYSENSELFKNYELLSSEIIDRTPKYLEFDDSFEGNFIGCKYRLCELKAAVTQITRGGRSKAYLFQGIIFCFHLKKMIHTPFKILKNAGRTSNAANITAMFGICLACLLLVCIAGISFIHKPADLEFAIVSVLFGLFILWLTCKEIFKMFKKIKNLKNKVSSIKFKPKGLSQKKVDIVTDDLN